MAQETLGQVPDLNLREAEEIERLIKEEEEKAADKIRRAHPLKKFLNRKLFLGLAAIILLVWGAGWGILNLMKQSPDVLSVSTVNQTQIQHFIPSNIQIQKPNIYPLEPFFIPILSKNKETGKFLHVTAHLVLSNRRLHKDIDKVRPLIRQSVYTVISRRKSKDFEKEGVKMEERIKREILTSSNSFLLSGTGTITNIIFTEFIVSPS
ncbi:MAG: flagellar basal body-associated FliL family protein [Nitrospinota bacterium]|nr:flagellar basal body-associated FliL family protein [Nitrospinota bacterium]